MDEFERKRRLDQMKKAETEGRVGLSEQARKPKRLTSKMWRKIARSMRDMQWEFADLVAKHGTIWVCWWDKERRHPEPRPDNVYVTGLIDGCELLEWLRSHRDWWVIGKWRDDRYAAPIRLTPKGRRAIKQRWRYDMEPVTGGMVDPGWIVTPAPAP